MNKISKKIIENKENYDKSIYERGVIYKKNVKGKL